MKQNTEEKDTTIINEEEASAAETDAKTSEDEASAESVKSADESTDGVSQLAKKDAEIASLKELMVRRQADFENYKKRTLRQEEASKKLLIKDMALDIMEINDNLIRASDAAVHIPDGESLDAAHKSYVDGVMMISKSIETMLEKYGIEEIAADQEEFNPNLHEAVDIQMSEEVTEDTVTRVYQKGFKLDEFVVRSAKVQVTKPAPKPVNGDEPENGEAKAEEA